MTFEKRREILFVYSVKDANPNGDPLNANHPRLDADSGQILVSDVRIKRTIRDQWVLDGEDVFVDGEPKTLKVRVDELKTKLSAGNYKEAIGKCLDTKLFGVTFALGSESFSWTGPVQFKWGRSLHKAKAEFVQGTAAFATKEGNDQRSFRNEYIVPFVVIGVYGIANQCASDRTGATENDVDKIADGLWLGTTNLITRSKIGHIPRFFLEIVYKKDFLGIAGSLDDKIKILTPDGKILDDLDAYKLRSMGECVLDISVIGEQLIAMKDNIESVAVWTDSETKLQGIDKFSSLPFTHKIR